MAITISGENNNDRITAADGVIDTISGFNISGIITASSFTGDLTGDVTGNLTGNVTGNINNSTLLLQTGGTERLRIESNGRIAVGGFSGASNDLHIKTASSPTIRLEDTTNTCVLLSYAQNSNAHVGTYSNHDLIFDTNSVESLRIKSSGTSAGGKAIFADEIETPQDYPTTKPLLDFNFTSVKRLDSRITYRRTGPASFNDEFGKVVIVGENVPRFDHTFPEYWDEGTFGDSNSKGESRGLLIEESRTNIYKNNHNLKTTNDHASVTQTVNTTETTAPDGTFTATKIDVTGGDQWTRFDGNNGLDIGEINHSDTYSTSIYMKTVGTSNVNVALDFGDSGNKTFSVGQEWKRYAISNVHNNYGASTKFIDLVLQGDIYIWGLQCEKAPSPSSYIPTSGFSQTRGTDVVRIEGEDFTNIYNDAEGTFILQASTGDLTTSTNQLTWGVEKSGGSADFALVGYRLGGGGSGYVGAWYSSGGTQAFLNMNGNVTQDVPFKAAFSYKTNDMDAVTNGGTLSSDNSATMAASGTFDRFVLGQYAAYGDLTIGHVQRIMYYTSKLTDNQLKTMTS